VDGYAKLDTNIDTKPAGNPDRFVPSTIPIGLSDAQQTAGSTMHARQTRINVDFRSPTELGSDFRTFAEIDFFGSDGPVDLRMRHFFGQLANVLVGQTWTTFTDADAVPDTLDDGAPVGASKLRQAQVRYTRALRPGHSLAVAAERPVTEARDINAFSGAYSPAPDVIVRYRFDASRGHLQAASIFRSLGYHGSERNTTILGTGINIASVWKVPNDDVVIGSVTYGRGIARYIDTLSGTNSDLDLNDAGTDVAALPAVAGYGAYTHFWPNRFRSTGTFGYGRVDTSEQQPASSFVDSYYVAANLLWNAVGSLNVGAEYLYGTHSVRSGDDAHASRVQIAAKYDFFRKRPLVP
jgi:DcaP outer membrane protein